jgi:hypothetical protein
MSNEKSSRKESITARDSSKSLSLKELIHAVRDELIASEEERVNDDKPALFEFETLDIEVLVVTKGRLAKRGFSLKVLPFLPFGADAQ